MLDVADFNKDASACEKVTGSDRESFRGECYRRVAVATENPDFCFIGRESWTALEQLAASVCTNNIAIKKENLTEAFEICKKSDSIYLNNCYRELAIARKDLSICEKIDSYSDVKANCIETVKLLLEIE